MKIASKIYAALVFTFLYAPIIVMIVFSFNSSSSTSVFSGFSLDWYKSLATNTSMLEALQHTLIIAVLSSIISTVMGTAAAIAINNYKLKWFKQATLTTTNIPMMNPDIVTGISMMLLFVFVGGIIGAIIGYGLNVKACTGTEIKITNSEIYAQYSGGVEAAGGTIKLENVKIDQKGGYSGAAWCSVAIGVNGGGQVIVTSGNYNAAPIGTDENSKQGTWVAYVMSSGGTLTINGGTFNGTVAESDAAANACGLICADRAAVVYINGGEFKSNGKILDMRNNVGTQPNPVVTLAGGTFSADPRESMWSSNLIHVAEDFEVKELENGKWGVVEKGE